MQTLVHPEFVVEHCDGDLGGFGAVEVNYAGAFGFFSLEVSYEVDTDDWAGSDEVGGYGFFVGFVVSVGEVLVWRRLDE